MIQPDVRTVELDRNSRERLRAGGLDYRCVDPSDEAALDGFIRAIARATESRPVHVTGKRLTGYAQS